MRRKSPIPQMEARLKDTIVLGNTQLRGSDIRLARASVRYRVNAGRLHGVTEGTVLGVYLSAEDKSRAGYVRVMKAETMRSFIR